VCGATRLGRAPAIEPPCFMFYAHSVSSNMQKYIYCLIQFDAEYGGEALVLRLKELRFVWWSFKHSGFTCSL
jgi:hypothetical protein